MKSSELSRSALGVSIAFSLLAGCGGLRQAQDDTQPSIAARTNTSNYKVVYSFGTQPDGNNPEASLIDVDGTLYGTTLAGGSYSFACRYYSGNGCGTVFSITTGGTEKVLHSFGYGADGTSPLRPLIEVKGTLYGTTFEGGAYPGCSQYFTGCGTVFSITTGGTETVLHSFFYGNGAQPRAPLINVKGTLYGTTYVGGANRCGLYYPGEGCGTVFSITTGGTEKVVYSFRFGRRGFGPMAGLIDVGGTLYGTTLNGGAHHLGTVFRITPGGREKVLHSFGKPPDGGQPTASLIDVGGTLYGTTTEGGSYSCPSNVHGCGTVVSITPSGTEKVLHSFGYGTDGANPVASLIEVKGTLYGTTFEGGAYSRCNYALSCGTVFSITTSGTETVLHNFGGPVDGAEPPAGLLNVKGTLYGTTKYGGAHNLGTVFALTP
jgi:uncharacterized repeat protein (TIGR03803 family)